MAEGTVHSIPYPQYADVILAFRTECSKYLNAQDKYFSCGWTLWQITGGEIEYSVEGSLRHGRANHALIFAPRDIVKIHSFSDDLAIAVLCVPEALMNTAMRTDVSKQKLLTLPVLLKQDVGIDVDMHHFELKAKTMDDLNNIFNILIDHVPPSSPTVFADLAMPLVEAMMLLIFESIGISHKAIRPESRMEKIAYNFMLSLPLNYLDHQDVEFYANRACVSVKYFTAVIKSVTSVSPTEWINRLLTTRARELLWLTDKTVNEISDELGFSSPPVFIRFFKRRTGCTPKQFKELQIWKYKISN